MTIMRSAQSIQDNDSYIAHFAGPLAAPQAVRLQQMPSWLANAAFNEAGSSNPRRITPPTPPHAKRTRVTTPPISPRTHALLQQAARSSPVAPDPGVNLALLDAPTLSIVRPDSLLVDLQGRTLEHPFHQGIAIGKAYGSHATNQAFQGNVVGLSLQGARIDQIRRVLAHNAKSIWTMWASSSIRRKGCTPRPSCRCWIQCIRKGMFPMTPHDKRWKPSSIGSMRTMRMAPGICRCA